VEGGWRVIEVAFVMSGVDGSNGRPPDHVATLY